MTANSERGEVELELGGKAYPLRPSYEAAQAIESKLGNLVKLYRRLDEDGDGLSCGELAIIVSEGIKAAGKDRNDKMLQAVTVGKIAQLVFEAGLISVFHDVMPFLANLLSGGAKKKADGVSE